MQLRLVHKWAGLVFAIWILNASITGMLRANASALYWKNRPSREQPVSLPVPAVDIAQLYQILEDQSGVPSETIQSLELKRLLQHPVYLVQGMDGSRILIDAAAGKKISPLSQGQAVRIASDYVPEGTPVREVKFLNNYRPRKARASRPAWRIVFEEPRETEIVIDRDSGEMLTLMDRGRRFGMWMVRLHELDFGGLRRPGLTALGLGTVFMTFTGLFLAWNARQRRRA